VLLGADRATVDAQQPGGGRAQEPGEAAFGGQLRVQLGALVGRELVAAGDLLLKVGVSSSRTCLSRSACSGLRQSSRRSRRRLRRSASTSPRASRSSRVAASATSTRWLEQHDCGVVVDSFAPDQLDRAAIELAQRMGDAARRERSLKAAQDLSLVGVPRYEELYERITSPVCAGTPLE